MSAVDFVETLDKQHRAPSFDKYGHPERGVSIQEYRANTAKIPEAWTHKPSHTTQKEMLKQRKWSAVPDPSFDLDGDGHVSQKDLFLAKHFDQDKDGKLNEAERRKAKEAMEAGFDKKFLFGLERAGLNDDIRNSGQDLKYIRIMQKDGKIIQGEDFTVLQRPQTVQDTARPRTRQELHERRRQRSLRELEGAFTLCPSQLETKRYSSQEKIS